MLWEELPLYTIQFILTETCFKLILNIIKRVLSYYSTSKNLQFRESMRIFQLKTRILSSVIFVVFIPSVVVLVQIILFDGCNNGHRCKMVIRNGHQIFQLFPVKYFYIIIKTKSAKTITQLKYKPNFLISNSKYFWNWESIKCASHRYSISPHVFKNNPITHFHVWQIHCINHLIQTIASWSPDGTFRNLTHWIILHKKSIQTIFIPTEIIQTPNK